ncbi:polysaccharide pyruvyl transferase family protein [Paraeggerthella hongkongensis]|uniref:polysaccharide pyruvyl transferase family protein n=1 Tax=Paraeggerthella hominis TaxID=2897351 RepID=UPI001C117725|nr:MULTISPECIES: polysaccharide pyruvyl transferase family protein [Paraeggerthella]MBU5405333.1 polysaccharide pyruvyl transferase family protein [Paraeggerthella hongkongensis]MCD2433297.1 polysaccharide pyruvyl transferase family protein [Paraeggerthella hominis]
MSRDDCYVVTFHSAWNYGASLQAFATIEVLKRLGIKASLLDYVNHYAKQKTTFELLRDGELKEACRVFVKDVVFKRKALHNRAFGPFHDSLPKSKQYGSVEELSEIEADCLIAGSDQIWSPGITGNLEPVFFLDFGNANKKISFASSLGNYRYSETEREIVKGYLSSFSHISVRERRAAEYLSEFVDKDLFRCLDPTLMLDAQFWDSFSEKPEGFDENERYIVVFNLARRSDEEIGLWKKMSQETGLPLWRICNNTYNEGTFDRLLTGMTPQEFVWILNHAAFVWTDSFHGTAFSVNLSTPFAAMTPINGNVSRIKDLLDLTHLSSRYVDEAKDVPFACDFLAAQDSLSAEREICTDWLNNALFN